MVAAIRNGCFSDDEVEEIGTQVKEKNNLRNQEARQISQRFAQYFANVKAHLAQQHTDATD
jgi:hypothetical protein